MAEELSTACRGAADALENLSNLRPGFTRNVIPRINSSTAVSVSQANSGERQVNDEELQANESGVNPRRRQPRAVLFKLGLPLSSRQLARTELAGKTLVEDQQSQSVKSNKGRPSKTLVYKVVVLIPSPKISKVPTHTARRQLEERELVCHEFPFGKSWDANSLKTAILNRFPQLLLFEYVKVGKIPLVL